MTGEQFGQTIVMITHNEEIAQMADRVIRIEDGTIKSGAAARKGETAKSGAAARKGGEHHA